MEMKYRYQKESWAKIAADPGYTLGRREQEALGRFLGESPLGGFSTVLHMGVATGQEVPAILNSVSVKEYILNDICLPALTDTMRRVKALPGQVRFVPCFGDIEEPGFLKALRSKAGGPTLFVLVGNASIFSNMNLDQIIYEAMSPGDLLMITCEEKNEGMFDSYKIDPAYELLGVSREECQLSYDESDSCLKINSGNEMLLASYKPNMDQFRKRMLAAGFQVVDIKRYRGIHMLAGLFYR